jgi:hypothetical protein
MRMRKALFKITALAGLLQPQNVLELILNQASLPAK